MKLPTKASELKIGDKIRIIAVPDVGIHRDTARVYKKIIERKRPVIIDEIDGRGTPWYGIKLRGRNGRWEWHFLAVFDHDSNWLPVRRRKRLRIS